MDWLQFGSCESQQPLIFSKPIFLLTFNFFIFENEKCLAIDTHHYSRHKSKLKQ